MKTEIFENYEAFLKREDKTINGVSAEFASENPNFKTDNITNKSCWNCSDCRSCSSCRDCSDCSYCSYCRYCSDCRDCSYCRYCSDCRSCSSCRDCSDCSYCSYCSDCSSEYGLNKGDSEIIIPIVSNIHQAVLKAVNGGENLDMSTWHTDEEIGENGAYCGTTHCRAGWVVALAGKEGVELEKQTSTEFAANVIYSKSSTIEVGPYHFYLTNEQSMADIELCAKLEKEGKTERPI